MTVGGFTLTNHGLVGVGCIAAELRDKLGETFGSGSGMAVDAKSWTREGASWRGTLWLLPDRGYNITGTIDYGSRLNRIEVGLTPPAKPDKTPATSASARSRRGSPTPSCSPMPARPAERARSRGGRHSAGRRWLSADAALAQRAHRARRRGGVVLARDGTFFVSDEYGPYIYGFSPRSRMLGAIRPPAERDPPGRRRRAGDARSHSHALLRHLDHRPPGARARACRRAARLHDR